MVVDVDRKPGGDGFAAFERSRRAGLVPGWLAAVRSASGGAHFYFPSDPDRPQRSWQAAKAHVDFRGDGGYIIVPPSTCSIEGTTSGYQVEQVNTGPARVLDAQRLRDFLDPRPGTPFADRPLVPQGEALRAVAAFRLAMPTAQLRFAGGTELALGDDGTEAGLMGGANAIIGGNYLTTFGRPMEKDRDAVDRVMEGATPGVNLGITPVGEKANSGHGVLYDTIKSL